MLKVLEARAGIEPAHKWKSIARWREGWSVLLTTMKPTMRGSAKAIREAGLCVSIAGGRAPIKRVFALRLAPMAIRSMPALS